MVNKQTGYLPSNNMRELIRDNALLLPAISRFDIAFGFGDAPTDQVCRENGVDTNTFLAVCHLLSGYHYSLSDISLCSLMGYLKRAHTSFLDVTFPRIRHNLLEAINYSSANEVSLLLMRFYDDYVKEVKRHMDHENKVIFGYVDRLLEGVPDENFNIARFSDSHSHTATKLNELKDLFIYHYKQKENARLSAVLFDIIMCERDMMSHFEVESKLFVPAVSNLEKKIQEQMRNAEETSASDPNEQNNDVLSQLSEREKDIIRCVARGKASKEIANELCISVHTVSTHRRNINSKLGIHSSAGLAIYAIINNLVDIKEVSSVM